MGAGIAIGPERVLTAHYLVLGASHVAVTALDGRANDTQRIALDHQSGLADAVQKLASSALLGWCGRRGHRLKCD